MSLLRDVILTYDRLFDFQHVLTAESGCALDIGVSVAVFLNGIDEFVRVLESQFDLLHSRRTLGDRTSKDLEATVQSLGRSLNYQERVICEFEATLAAGAWYRGWPAS